MKYRLRPIEVDAVQAVKGEMALLPGIVRDFDRQAWIVRGREGDVEIFPGDWVITGMANDHFVIRDITFQMVYEPVEKLIEQET